MQQNEKGLTDISVNPLIFNGAPETIRTSGLRIRSPLLYPAELRAQQEKFLTDLYGFGKIKNWLKTYFFATPK